MKKNKIQIVADKDLEAIQEDNKFALQETALQQKQILHIMQRTPANHIFTRPAKGGGTWTFVSGIYVKKVLNYVFGWNWDFEIIDEQEKHKQVIVRGKLTVRDAKGQAIIKMQFGRADIKYRKGTETPLDYGNDLKAATTDALKKCASELGVASDIYGKNEFKDIQITADDFSDKEKKKIEEIEKHESKIEMIDDVETLKKYYEKYKGAGKEFTVLITNRKKELKNENS